jgi:GDPmannose 4,6-dehydratase
VRVDPEYFRPTEVDLLVGNPGKARRRLGWTHTVTLPEPVAEMVAHDLAALRGDAPAESAIEAAAAAPGGAALEPAHG